MIFRKFAAGVVLCGIGWAAIAPRGTAAESTVVPLLAAYDMEPDQADSQRLVDRGPLALDGRLEGAKYVAGGHAGQALRFDGPASKAVVTPGKGKSLSISTGLTLSTWILIERLPRSGHATLFGHPDWQMQVGSDGNLSLKAHRGAWDYEGPWTSVKPLGRWVHLAITFRQGGRVVAYINGQPKGSGPGDFYIWTGNGPLQFGGTDWTGCLDEVRIYAGALSAEQVQSDMLGKLTATRAPTAADAPPPLYGITLQLTRYDCPRGQDSAGARLLAQRRDGPDAIDWPALAVNGQPAFAEGPTHAFYGQPRHGGLLQEPDDPVIWPGNHWFRIIDWLWGRKHAYTADGTARGNVQEYDLWTFPLVIRGTGANDVRDVRLSMEGKFLYEKPGPWRSLTLLLPQNELGKPYQLSVAGRGPVPLDVGLEPIVPGSPHEKLRAVDLRLPGNGPAITVRTPDHPDPFPYQKQWEDDVKAAAAAGTEPPAAAEPLPGVFAQRIGVTVPRSPIAVYAAAIPHGMTGGGGFFYVNQQQGSPAKPYSTLDDYARFVAGMGYDRVIEMVEHMPPPGDEYSYERWAAALGRHGVQSMISPDVAWKRPYLAHPNLAFFSHNLPDWHAPLYRDLQLAVQRLCPAPGFAGVCIGADNGGYVSYWDWAPPAPDRPWGEAFMAFAAGHSPRRPNPGESDFLAYVARYDETFRQYGYFASAVSRVDSRLVTTTGSFGSSPGVGARGGWPWATVPGEPMHEGLPVLQAYDWNELPSSKPMHAVALIDRLKSYFPAKPAWSLIDDFCFLHDRATRQRAWALALTRGIQAIGTTFLPAPVGERAWPNIVAQQQELYAWVHRFGGVYAATRPLAPLGILYVHAQAVLRRTNQDVNASDEELIDRGCHEGKTTEALFLCHAAGWPARIVTPEELRRGLPAEMKTLLLVGLPKIDPNWLWYQGLENALGAFVRGGGQILLDHDSVCPVQAVRSAMRIRSYVPQRGLDWTPELLARNAENIARLRTAMAAAARPCAFSQDPALWAVPTASGDMWYVTAVNQRMVDETSVTRRPVHDVEVAGTKVTDKFAAQPRLTLQPRCGTLTWNTDRPVYDLRTQRLLSTEQRAAVDLTQDAFQFYALPPAPPTQPAVTCSQRPDGFFEAQVKVGEQPMAGIPIEIEIKRAGEKALIFGATGTAIRLPVCQGDPPGEYPLRATELLSGKSATAALTVAKGSSPAPIRQDLRQFASRRDVPLVIALTPVQSKDAAVTALARRLLEHYTAAGRKVEMGRVEPGGVVLGLQPCRGVTAFPCWRTADHDLVLLGSPCDNVLLLDQLRGGLLPAATGYHSGHGQVHCVYSAFSGEYDVVDLLGSDVAGLVQACELLVGAKSP